MPSRPDAHDPSTLRVLTQAVHAGNSVDEGSGAIRTPIVMANSYALPDDPSGISWSGTDIPLYTRNSGVNQLALQQKLAALDHGEDAVALASGVAALHSVFFTFLSSGDHVVVSDVVYEATHRLFTELFPQKYGIHATLVDTGDPEAVRTAMRENTVLVHAESPANPTTRIADIEALAKIAHAGGALLSVDATFASPMLMRPLDLGADLVVHSLTKYINGHGDAMGGAVIGSRELIQRIKSDAMVDVGGVISPFNAWLIMRGSVTLPLRMRQHSTSAQAVAEYLEADRRVDFVAYPGLPSHPQFDLARRTMPDGCGGMMVFALNGDHDAHNRFVANLRVVTSAVSLGHDESLIVHSDASSPRAEHWPVRFRRNDRYGRTGHLRFSVGLEDAADIIADLAAALDATDGL
ncbi:trans-sulfuration enzyme family protein [Marisediminicola senii]|uniref:trans-sulfuration enzyme family protein n=1 Tax=Marisediminicola senii TaxID=2711233 RepID=UPI0013ED9AA5|nr:aminotransferase class I/II-fold pyridoxal phosphate-dependent enzyme [Marisediminicola senii]